MEPERSENDKVSGENTNGLQVGNHLKSSCLTWHFLCVCLYRRLRLKMRPFIISLSKHLVTLKSKT